MDIIQQDLLQGDFHVGKTKRRLHDQKTEHFKALAKNCQASICQPLRITLLQLDTIEWDHFEILATGRCDIVQLKRLN